MANTAARLPEPPSAPSASSKTSFPHSDLDTEVKELRIALVLTGGVSLAIYMFGVTLELHKLVRASRALEAFLKGNLRPEPHSLGSDLKSATVPDHGVRLNADMFCPGAWDTEDVYIEALLQLTSGSRRRLAISLDVIAGSSAGGINGILLGKALSFNRSLDHIKRLWIDHGGIGELVKQPSTDQDTMLKKADGFLESVKASFGMRASALRRSKDGVWPSIFALIPAAARLVHNPQAALLSGAAFSGHLHEAFKEMEERSDATATSLIPHGETLELLVTCTSVRGLRGPILSSDLAGVTGTSYRQVMRFTHSSLDDSSFSGLYTSTLAFAARVTSSFPGAFPPVSINKFEEDVNSVGENSAPITVRFSDDISASTPRFLYGARSSETNPATAQRGHWFMDGGVCDNYPFDICTEAILNKPASRQVSRELVYLEPDPRTAIEPHAPGEQPTVVEALRQAISVIPSHISLVDSLARLNEVNATIEEIGDFTEELMDQLLADHDRQTADNEVPEIGLPSNNPLPPLGPPHTSLHARGVYDKMKLIEEGKRFGIAVAARLGYPPKSAPARAIVSTFSDLDLLRPAPDVSLAFALRRAEFALQGLNKALGDPQFVGQRAALLSAKRVCWEWKLALASKGRKAVDIALDSLLYPSSSETADPIAYIKTEKITLWVSFASAIESLPPIDFPQLEGDVDQRLYLKLQSRWRSFLEWDQLLFPLLNLARIPALKPIHARRFSPLDATLLFGTGERATEEHRAGVKVPGQFEEEPAEDDNDANLAEEKKVHGKKAFHFGAFLKKEWRENDYLIGRLDGLEMILKLLTDQANRGASQPSVADIERQKREDQQLQRCLAFVAYNKILEAEGWDPKRQRAREGGLNKDLLAFVNERVQDMGTRS